MTRHSFSMDFSNQMPLLGGLLIGLSAALLMFSHGKICGLSGIFESWMKSPKEKWRWYFLFGFFFGSVLIRYLKPSLTEYAYNLSVPFSIVAGLLVGYGTRMAGGCTSGHGICGTSRFSKRSIVATLVFMATAVIVVWVRQL